MNSKIFKTVTIGGFDKIEVLNYIKEIDSESKRVKRKSEDNLNQLTLKFERVSDENKLLREELNDLKSEIEKILEEKKRMIHETSEIIKKTKMFKEKHDDITKILLDIESKRKTIIEEANKESENIVMKAKLDAQNIITDAKHFSENMLKQEEDNYKKTVEARSELVKIIGNSRKIFNKISDEAIELINTNKNEL